MSVPSASVSVYPALPVPVSSSPDAPDAAHPEPPAHPSAASACPAMSRNEL